MSFSLTKTRTNNDKNKKKKHFSTRNEQITLVWSLISTSGAYAYQISMAIFGALYEWNRMWLSFYFYFCVQFNQKNWAIWILNGFARKKYLR